VFGENEFAARFPNALLAAFTALVLLLWGTRIGGSQTGWRAALIFSLSLQVIIHARAAVADMAMVFFVALSAWCGWEFVTNERNRLRWGSLCWLAMGFGFLAKGPIALLPIGMLACASFASGLRTRVTRPPRPWEWLAGVVLMLIVVGIWGVPAMIRTNGEFAAVGLGKHVVSRSFVAMEGHGAMGIAGYLATLPFYFVTIWITLFPGRSGCRLTCDTCIPVH